MPISHVSSLPMRTREMICTRTCTFERAAEYYLLALKKNKEDRNLRLKIAKSYRKLHDFDNAVLWYDSAYSDSVQFDVDELYHYAESLLSAGKYAEAIDWYEKYLDAAGARRNTPQKIIAIENLRLFLRDSVLYSTQNLFINTEDNEFGAQYYDQGIVYLSSGGRDPFIDHDVHRDDTCLIFSMRLPAGISMVNQESSTRI